MPKNNTFTSRRYVINAIFLVIALVFIIRIFFLQIIDKSNKSRADNNVFRYLTEFPARGLVYDRNGKPLLFNEATYDLMVIPHQMGKTFDTVGFCKLINNDIITFRKKIKSDSGELFGRNDKLMRHIENQVHTHLRYVMSETESLVKGKVINGVFIGGHQPLFHLIEKTLPADLQKKLRGDFVTELNIPEPEIIKHCAHKLEEYLK